MDGVNGWREQRLPRSSLLHANWPCIAFSACLTAAAFVIGVLYGDVSGVSNPRPHIQRAAPTYNASYRKMCQRQFHDVLEGRFALTPGQLSMQQDLQSKLDAFHGQQGSTVNEGHTGQTGAVQQTVYMQLASIPCVRTICEIGFNAGHSASVWMTARDDLHLVSFDNAAHPYVYTAIEFYTRSHPGRITFTLGDSLQTVPRVADLMHHRCDLIVVDGYHKYEYVLKDIMNMATLANPSFNIIIVDDVNCPLADYCVGPAAAVRDASDRGIINMVYKASMNHQGQVVPEQQATRGFSVGSYLF